MPAYAEPTLDRKLDILEELADRPEDSLVQRLDQIQQFRSLRAAKLAGTPPLILHGQTPLTVAFWRTN